MATTFTHRGCIRSPTHRSLFVLLCVPRTADVRGSAQLYLYLIKDRRHFSIWESDGPSHRIFGPKSDDLDHQILKLYLIPSDFAISDCLTRPIHFFRPKSKNLKLGIGSRKNQPQYHVFSILIINYGARSSYFDI